MVYKFFHLNIYLGRFLPNLVKFLKKNKFDILNFQEVTGNQLSFEKKDCFSTLKSHLPGYTGKLLPTWWVDQDPTSYFSNASFIKKPIKIMDKKVLWLKKNFPIFAFETRRVEEDPRSVLILKLQLGSHHLTVLNTHLAWGPTPKDQPYKLKQGQILLDYLKTIKEPFLLSGDFNLTGESKIVKSLNRIGQNLTEKFHLKNTLNPKTHRLQHLFPPGLAVDFVFASKKIEVKSFKTLTVPALSDHLPLLLEFRMVKNQK